MADRPCCDVQAGFWELLPPALAPPVLPVDVAQWVVYRPLHHAQVDALAAATRSAPRRHLIPVRDAVMRCASTHETKQ
jgi:hypothetical protein